MATATTFDWSKLVKGKRYPMRGGHPAEFVRRLLGTDPKLLFIVNIDDFEMAVETDLGGMWAAGGEYDVVSDEPWSEPKKPVDIRVEKRYAVVWNDGSVAHQYELLEQAMRHAGPHAGIYELPETILVQPK